MEPNEEKLRIPAFMRGKELQKKAQKKILFTALDRQIAGLNKKKTTRARKTIFKETPSLVSGTQTIESSPLLEENNAQEFSGRMVPLKIVGEITHYFEKINVAVLNVTSTIKEGEIIIIGRNKQLVDSMQINRKPVKIAYPGDDIGMKLNAKPEIGDKVYMVEI